MPSVVIKPDRDRDFYVIWSTITDGPGARGSAAEIAAELAEHPEWYGTGDPTARIQRADRDGSSAMGGWRFGWWGDTGFIVNWDTAGEVEVGSRWISRANLAAWLDTGDEALTKSLEDALGP